MASEGVDKEVSAVCCLACNNEIGVVDVAVSMCAVELDNSKSLRGEGNSK